MAGSIAEFKSKFTNELARPSRFDVFIPIPNAVSTLIDSSVLSFRCESADLPGRALATTTQKIYGPEQKFPYQTTYNDINMTFICTENMIEKVFFDQWLNTINPNIGYGYDFRYKEDYASDIKIRQYDIQNEISYQVALYKAFPIGVNDLQLDWSSDGYHKLTVTFAYNEWQKLDNYVQPQASKPGFIQESAVIGKKAVPVQLPPEQLPNGGR
jgi:hypothetical protein